MELTLIEIAQETQTDDVPGGGRRPYKSLKSLFNKLVALSQQQSAPQVAATEHPARRHAQVALAGEAAPRPEQRVKQESAPAAPAAPTAPAPAAPAATAHKRMGDFSVSFKSLKTAGPAKKAINEPEVTNKDEKTQFSPSDLSREWLAMCNRMPQDMAGLAARLKHISPQITNYPNIELVVNNQGLLDQVNLIKNRIRKTMAMALHNGNIDFSTRLAKAEEVKPILSKRELFDKLRKENHALEQAQAFLFISD